MIVGVDPRQKVTCGEAVVAMVFSIACRIVGKRRVVLPEHRYIYNDLML